MTELYLVRESVDFMTMMDFSQWGDAKQEL